MSLRENLWHDDLSQLDLRAPLAVSPSTSLGATIEVMRRGDAGCVLVCEGDRLRGIFTERDYLKRVLAGRADLDAPLEKFMTADPVTIERGDPIGLVIRKMVQGHYRRLPVVDDGGVPIGTVSVKRVVKYLADHFPAAVYNLPPQPGQNQDSREGA